MWCSRCLQRTQRTARCVARTHQPLYHTLSCTDVRWWSICLPANITISHLSARKLIHFTVTRRAEGWVNLGNAVRVTNEILNENRDDLECHLFQSLRCLGVFILCNPTRKFKDYFPIFKTKRTKTAHGLKCAKIIWSSLSLYVICPQEQANEQNVRFKFLLKATATSTW